MSDIWSWNNDTQKQKRDVVGAVISVMITYNAQITHIASSVTRTTRQTQMTVKYIKRRNK